MSSYTFFHERCWWSSACLLILLLFWQPLILPKCSQRYMQIWYQIFLKVPPNIKSLVLLCLPWWSIRICRSHSFFKSICLFLQGSFLSLSQCSVHLFYLRILSLSQRILTTISHNTLTLSVALAFHKIRNEYWWF